MDEKVSVCVSELTLFYYLLFIERNKIEIFYSIKVNIDFGRMASDTTATTTTERIYSYSDGTIYMGHMRVNTDDDDKKNKESGNDSHTLRYLRHGQGTLRTPAFVYGIPLKDYTSEEAVEQAQYAKWHEYMGTWENDKLHGYGVHIQKSGDGGEIVVFEGSWENGKPVKSIYAKEDYDFDDSVFGW